MAEKIARAFQQLLRAVSSRDWGKRTGMLGIDENELD